MKRILIFIIMVAGLTGNGRAQESATQQQLDQLRGQIQDLLEGQAQQGKRLDAMMREISDLRDKVNVPPPPNDSASRDDLKKLAEQVQEIDRKRQADKELILANLEKLGKVSGDTATPTHSHKKKSDMSKTDTGTDVKSDAPAGDTTAASGPHYEYKVQPGDSFGLIVKAYRDKGVKVTRAQVLKANPGLDPDKLYVGKTIVIPDPSAK